MADTQDTHGHADKRIVVGRNGGTLTPFDSARGRAAALRSAQARRNRAMQAARARTVARLAAYDNTIQSWADAWGDLVADQAEALRHAASEGKPRGDDMLRVGQALGAMPLPHELRDSDSDSAPAHSAPGIVLLLHEIERRGVVVDAEVVEDG